MFSRFIGSTGIDGYRLQIVFEEKRCVKWGPISFSETQWAGQRDLVRMGSAVLPDWILKGLHFPSVDIFYDPISRESFQVNAESKLFRRSLPASGNGIMPYGDWEPLE